MASVMSQVSAPLLFCGRSDTHPGFFPGSFPARLGIRGPMSLTNSAVSPAPAPLSCAGSADAITASELRRVLQSWLRKLPQASPEISDDIVLGVNEALANCVEHAYRARNTVGTMELEAGYDPAAETIRVCVSDRGPGDDNRRRAIPTTHAPLAASC